MNDFEYKIGMEIGLIDPIEMTKDSVKWYTIVFIEPDPELCVAFLYLASTQDKENIHSILSADGTTMIPYAEIIDSISDLIVLP